MSVIIRLIPNTVNIIGSVLTHGVGFQCRVSHCLISSLASSSWTGFQGLIITGKLYGSSLCFGPGENHNGGDFVNL